MTINTRIKHPATPTTTPMIILLRVPLLPSDGVVPVMLGVTVPPPNKVPKYTSPPPLFFTTPVICKPLVTGSVVSCTSPKVETGLIFPVLSFNTEIFAKLLSSKALLFRNSYGCRSDRIRNVKTRKELFVFVSRLSLFMAIPFPTMYPVGIKSL